MPSKIGGEDKVARLTCRRISNEEFAIVFQQTFRVAPGNRPVVPKINNKREKVGREILGTDQCVCLYTKREIRDIARPVRVPIPTGGEGSQLPSLLRWKCCRNLAVNGQTKTRQNINKISFKIV